MHLSHQSDGKHLVRNLLAHKAPWALGLAAVTQEPPRQFPSYLLVMPEAVGDGEGFAGGSGIVIIKYLI